MSVGTSLSAPASASPPRTLADRTAALVVRRRRLIIIGWLVLIAVCVPLAATLAGALSGAGWNAAGSDSEQVRQELRRDFAQLGAEAAVVVVNAGDPAGREPAAAQVVAALRGHPDVRAVTDPAGQPAQAGLVSADGTTALVPVHLRASSDSELPEAAHAVRDRVAAIDLPPGVRANVTGEWPMWADSTSPTRRPCCAPS